MKSGQTQGSPDVLASGKGTQPVGPVNCPGLIRPPNAWATAVFYHSAAQSTMHRCMDRMLISDMLGVRLINNSRNIPRIKTPVIRAVLPASLRSMACPRGTPRERPGRAEL
jgi:hypothetical protein